MAPLSGFTVVDLSSGIAGGYCTKLLADGGAHIIKVESPEGDSLRGWSASGSPVDPVAGGPLFSYLASSKHSVIADPEDLGLVDKMLQSADAVVWSAGSRLTEAFAAHEIRNRHPHLIVTALTPFGLDGPWQGRAATEFTLQAWSGGAMGLGRGSQDRAPVHVGGQVGDWLAGTYASALTLAAKAAGPGRLVDVSMLEAQIMGLTYYPVTFFEVLGRPWRTERRPTVPGVAQAADGLVALGCGTAQQWFDLCAMSGHVEWIAENSPLSITEQANLHAAELYEWLAGEKVDEIRELASAFRIPNSPVANGHNVTGFDHYEARGVFTRNPRDGFSQPGHPYRLSTSTLRAPEPAPALGEHTALYRNQSAEARSASPKPVEQTLPFEGLRVLDMTTFWAGPSCTHVLAMLGAEVIHLESTPRPDGTRLIAGVPVSEAQWWEKSPIFSALNTNKKSLTLDFGTELGQELLRKLIPTCDVVVENFTPRVIDQLGLGYAAVRELRDDVIMLRMPGFGLDGPWRDNPAFAYIIEDASGLAWLTGYPDRNPCEPYSVGDPNAGIHALNALLLALEHRRRTGEGQLVEAAMVDAALSIAAEQVIEYSANGVLLHRAGNRGPAAAPQNLYLTAGIDEFGRQDCWVAIAVATDEHWLRLRGALGEPEWAMGSQLLNAGGRRAHHDELDEQLSAWCLQRSADAVVDALWPAGVPVATVMQPHRQRELPPLAHRGFFEAVRHPVNGTAAHTTLPVPKSFGIGTFHRRPAPLLGQHNREILAGLGLSEAGIAEAEHDGVIGTEPAMGGRRKAAGRTG